MRCAYCALQGLQYRINRIPFKAIRLHYPVEMFREYVAEM
jgi:hypothetical protein